jgi:hypothetical protein
MVFIRIGTRPGKGFPAVCGKNFKKREKEKKRSRPELDFF